jgi:hypothetical protein
MEKGKCEIEFRPYSEGDIDKIIDLLKSNWTYLQSQDGLRHWKWLYTSYRGGKGLVVVADHKGKIVGHYAMFPMKMRYGSSTTLGGKAEGSAVHEDYRGNIAERFCPQEKDFRIFGKLIDLLWQEAAAGHVSLIWGFPNAAAVKPQARAGYSHHLLKTHSLVMPFEVKGTIDSYYAKVPLKGIARRVFLASARGYCRLRMKRKALDRAKVTTTEVAFRRISPEDLDTRLERFIKAYSEENRRITVERDSDYIRWRFMDNPVVPHRVFVSERSGEYTAIIAANTLEKDGRRTANIVDIVAKKGSGEDLKGLLCHVARELRAEKTACIRIWMNDCEQSRRYVKTLRKIGFVNLPTGLVGRKMNFIYRFLDPSLNRQFAEDPENWYITEAFSEGTG